MRKSYSSNLAQLHDKCGMNLGLLSIYRVQIAELNLYLNLLYNRDLIKALAYLYS